MPFLVFPNLQSKRLNILPRTKISSKKPVEIESVIKVSKSALSDVSIVTFPVRISKEFNKISAITGHISQICLHLAGTVK
jgi:hypothetical protein